MTKPEPAARRMTRILIVDDHPIVREGFAALLSREPDCEVCGEAADANEALRQVERQRPDVVLVDLSLGEADGLELVRRIHTRNEGMPIVVCSMHGEAQYAERALHAGALGYVNKDEATRTIVAAIRRVRDGKIYLSETMTDRLTHRFVGQPPGASPVSPDMLSNRELQIFRSIGHGQTTSEIASNLHISMKTVDTHRQRIKNKLRLKNATQLACAAAQWVHDHE